MKNKWRPILTTSTKLFLIASILLQPAPTVLATEQLESSDEQSTENTNTNESGTSTADFSSQTSEKETIPTDESTKEKQEEKETDKDKDPFFPINPTEEDLAGDKVKPGDIPLPDESSLRSRMSSANQTIIGYINSGAFTNPSIQNRINNFIPRFSYVDGVGKPRGIIIHETANPRSTIQGEISYMLSNWNNAFVHAFVDKDNIIEVHPTDYAAWGAGREGNKYFMHVELVEHINSRYDFLKSVNNDAFYVATKLKQYGLAPSRAGVRNGQPTGTVWSHHEVSSLLGGTNHTDPTGYFATFGYTFNDFFELVQYKYDNLDTTPPKLTASIKNIDNNKETFDVIVNANATTGIRSVQVPVWTKADQSDLRWYDAVKQADQTYKVTVNSREHGYSEGPYTIHAYATAGNGKRVGIPVGNIVFNLAKLSGDTLIKDTNGKETLYRAEASIKPIDYTEISTVYFATWSEKGGQNDLQWYKGRNEGGKWVADIDIRNHKTEGTYQVHTYVETKNGKMQSINASSFTVTKPSLTGKIENISKEKGTFDVVLAGNAVSGIASVKVPIWSQSNQSDLKWYTAEKQSDGTYKVEVDIQNHQNNYGTYRVDAYLYASNGTQTDGQRVSNVQLEMPKLQAKTTITDTDSKETTYRIETETVPVNLPNQGTVMYAVWSHVNGQDDLRWYEASKVNDKWQANFPLRNHKDHGMYHVHTYMRQNNGNMTALATNSFNVTQPELTGKIQNIDENAGTFDVVLEAQSVADVDTIKVPIWSQSNQSDLKWYTAEKQSDGTYRVKVNIADHKNNYGTYRVHAYLYATNGTTSGGKVIANVPLKMPQLNAKTTIIDTNAKETIYRMETDVAPANYSDLQSIMYAVWSHTNGQDDLRWYEASKVSNKWQVNVPISNHKDDGTYHVHTYMKQKNGGMKALTTSSFTVTKPELTGEIQNIDENSGTFDVVLQPKSISDIENIKVPIWSQSNQSDLRWYNGEKQADGSYKVKVNIANHNYNYGTYRVHAYLYAKNGTTSGGKVIANVPLTMPALSGKTTITDTTKKETVYQMETLVTPAGYSNVQSVMYAVWSRNNGQDDLRWYEASKVSNKWQANVLINNHKDYGIYHVHTYIKQKDGTMKALTTNTFTVTEPTLTGEVKNINKSSGTFEVLLSGTSVSDIEEIQVPIWSKSNQSDIKWYDAVKQADGKYKVVFDIMNHQNSAGTYTVHAYLYGKNGVKSQGQQVDNIPMTAITDASPQARFIREAAYHARQVAPHNDLYTSVMVAQAALETGYGTSALSKSPNYNLFGIKGRYNGNYVLYKTMEYDKNTGTWYQVNAEFRKYPSYKESFMDNADKLVNGVSWNANYYSGTWRKNCKSYKDATAWLTGRYATDPQYANKLNSIIERWNLTQFD